MVLIGLFVGLPGAPPGFAQAPVAGEDPPPATLSAQQLEELVGRIALYPDDLLAIILPAATFPLDIVQQEDVMQAIQQFREKASTAGNVRTDDKQVVVGQDTGALGTLPFASLRPSGSLQVAFRAGEHHLVARPTGAPPGTLPSVTWSRQIEIDPRVRSFKLQFHEADFS